jgi:2-aminoethylphosphonate-pyruvate transaminase
MTINKDINQELTEAAHSPTGDAYLLTPGPLTTSITVKQAMLHDYGSRDVDFVELNQIVCEKLLTIVDADDDFECVPLQGSGTFAVEAMLATMIPTKGKLLNLVNGAYGHRITEICRYLGRECRVLEFSEDKPVDVEPLDKILDEDKSISHVSIIHCETTSGVLNPLIEISKVVKKHKRALLIDAMSTFGGMQLSLQDISFTALTASSNKCLQGVPGMGFCIVDKSALSESKGNAHSLSLDLYKQAQALNMNGQWRFTPPVHCILALAQALKELEQEGGVVARQQRYRNNCEILRGGMRELGFETLLADEVQAPIIITFLIPENPAFLFQEFYDLLSLKGYLIYPGKITDANTFRIGCIGALAEAEMRGFLNAVKITLAEMGVNILSTGSA